MSGYTRRWSSDEINEWYARRPWLCGFNYLPRAAVNWIELWQAESFDAATIDQELGWAQAVGFNTLRTNLHPLVWSADPAGMRARLDTFLGIASRHGLSTMLCLFDDCGFSGIEPHLGRQGDPIPGVHNSGAVASPGRAVVRDRAQWPRLQRYVEDIVGHFTGDERIVAWDLYNEPGNDSVFVPERFAFLSTQLLPHSLDLLQRTFEWARASRPTQPLTTGVWFPAFEENRILLDLSDFVTFHNYSDLAATTAQVDSLRSEGRPIVCTEWLARNIGSMAATHLPYFKAQRVGCYHWGLVNGRTQTHLAWPGFEAAGNPWQHDLFHADGREYDGKEMETFRASLRA